jgi:ABC-type dipeptide/oligopeptide/nickel transport system permease component
MSQHPLGRFVMARLLWALPLILVVLIVNFVLTHILPGDPIVAIVGEYPAPPDYVASIRQTLGLDHSLALQLWLYLVSLAHGDLGYSFANRQPVVMLVLNRAGNTLLLMLPALVVSSLLGILLGMLAASRRGGLADALVSAVSLLGYSLPVFWVGQVLVIAFAVNLHWLPALGMLSLRGVAPGLPTVWDFIVHWLLPGTASSLFYAAVVARVARASIREMMNQDFTVTALAKGLSEREVLWKHVLPNSMMPIVSVIGYNFGAAVTGTMMVEAVFAWPGIGSLFMGSISQRDYPVLQGIFLLASITVILANIATDMLYFAIDPRIRQGRAGR